MADFGGASMWIKLSFLLTMMVFALDLFLFDTTGWATFADAQKCDDNGSNCSKNWYEPVMAFEVIAFLCILTAVALILCIVLLDELKGNKIALICYTVFILAGALCLAIGAIWFEATYNGGTYYIYSEAETAMAFIMAVLAGVFAILELCGVGGKK